MKAAIVQVGVFPDAQQQVIDAEFERIPPEAVMAEPALASRVEAIVTRSNYQVAVALVEALPRLKVIATSGVGFDGIPHALARSRGVEVTHTPGVLDTAVSELAIGLLLALLRELPASDRYVRDGRWVRQGPYPLTTGLAGKRVGIVGLGRIGQGIAERLAPFGVDLGYSNPRPRSGVQWAYFSDVAGLAAASDILMVCCPGGPATHHLVDAKVLQALGPEGFLVNVSRGTVVDEASLCDALATGRLRGAALDVFANEPLDGSPLTALPNALLTPHAGSATREARAQMLRLTLDNVHAALAGRPALTPVPSAV